MKGNVDADVKLTASLSAGGRACLQQGGEAPMLTGARFVPPLEQES
jgi:hypothetical protein